MTSKWRERAGSLHYGGTFHRTRDADTGAAAARILGLLTEVVSARSVCDVGCGVGTWLRVARELGAEELAGFEGTWLDRAALVVEPELVECRDLEKPLPAARRFDLAICLEVAEHLLPGRAAGLVADLAGLSDVVLFSAAIPHQGGTGHRNERWQSHWAGLFAEHGYEVFDPIRPAIWSNPNIPFWYRQNVLVYARAGSAACAALRARGNGAVVLDMVHPVHYERQVRPGLGSVAKMAARTVRRALRGRS